MRIIIAMDSHLSEDEKPVRKEINNFTGNQCCLVRVFKEKDGTVTVGLREKPGEDPYKIWRLKEELSSYETFPETEGEQEKIITYVVWDENHKQCPDCGDNRTFDDARDGQLDNFDEAPEYCQKKKKESN
jgi:hypothetical protein